MRIFDSISRRNWRSELKGLAIARYTIEGKPNSICHTDRERGWRTHRHQAGKTGHRGFLHHLKGATARNETEAMVGEGFDGKQRAYQLVERIVPANVLSDNQKLASNANPS